MLRARAATCKLWQELADPVMAGRLTHPILKARIFAPHVTIWFGFQASTL
jgi:hypothetical protein